MSGRIDVDAFAASKRLDRIGEVLLVGSGKGGVGKTLVSCGIALSLAREGYKTGLFDVDIHGASVPGYLGVRPPLKSTEKGLEPKVANGIEVMSTALLTGDNPTPLKGGKKRSAITSLFALTNWGKLDFLVVDLPPSTGDEVLAAFALFGRKSEMVLVTTPSWGATGVVLRLRKLAESEGVEVRGVVVNMSHLKRGRQVLYPFGRPDTAAIGKDLLAPVIAEIPLEPRVASEPLAALLEKNLEVSRSLRKLGSLVLGDRS